MALSLRTRQPGRGAPSTPVAPPHGDRRPEDVARESGGPQDTALYRCPCGHLFEAPVSASASCPSCGADQSW